MVFTIIAVEVQLKLIEVKAVPVFSVSFCLFNLTYQSRIHCINLLFRGNIKKHTREYPRVFNQRAWVLPEISAYWHYLDVMSIVLFKMRVNDECQLVVESYGICRV